MAHPYLRKRKYEVRNPNTGPYVVTYGRSGFTSQQECQTWADACHLMRHLLVEGHEIVQVRFA